MIQVVKGVTLIIMKALSDTGLSLDKLKTFMQEASNIVKEWFIGRKLIEGPDQV